MAAEWAPYGIRVNALSPGVVPTKMREPALNKNREAMTDAMSLRRLGTEEDIGNVVLALASDVSRYVTGANNDVGGGKFLVQNTGARWS
jgi:NAD(P)-dependent dehydrogenase (short-subunit alcohol dehydrogenase family)